MKKQFDLSGKIAVVTGGSKGLGAQIIKDFANAGADMVIASRSLAKCEVIAQEVSQLGVRALPLKCDVSNVEDINRMYDQIVQEFGRVDILVNNAGIYQTMPDLEVTEEVWDSIYNVNVKGLFFSAQAAAKIMIPQKSGKIINLSSATAIKALKRMSPYTSSKAAVMSLTRSLASEWARYNIHVNAIAPGIISTDINADELGDEQTFEHTLKKIPLRRYGVPTDISSMAVYLASPYADYITGQTFAVDGGFLAE